ncbi:MAG: peptide chain release factor N(5)-glutamine methyltransferase [Kiritimatiellae bacterium]|nr:peptide chain release factor N(5)-glutamine methyltransferase [Kiritimatiellia bacterium]
MPLPLRELLARGDAFLQRKGIPDARVVCELLAARLLQCGRMELYRFADTTPAERLVEALRRGIKRVAYGEPVQYVLGQWDFRRLTLKVDRRALIPRPETEELVEWVLRSPQAQRGGKPLVVDVGTGTGCIILSLAREMADGFFVGLDISPEALELARENAERTGLADKVHFAESDGCGEFDPASVDILVSNPPYIPSGEIGTLDPWIRNHEPLGALDGGADGLDLYRSFLMDAIMVLKPGGGVFFEIGDGQGPALRELMESCGLRDIRIEKDFAGHDRYAIGTQDEI